MTLARRMLRAVIPARIRAVLRTARFERRVSHFPRRTVRHTYAGVPLEVELADPVAEQWYDRDWERLPEVEVLREHRLRPGALVFDIGAHQAVVAMVLASAVAPGGRVVALEASPHSAEVGELNRRRNGVDNLRVVGAAIAARAGTLWFSELGHQVQEGPGGVAVPAVTIDQLAEEHGRPDVVYLDVEGFEWEALRGATATLDARPDWMVEVHTGAGLERFGGSVEEVLDVFRSRGYELLVAPEAGLCVPFAEGRDLLGARFMLVALGG